MIDKQYIYGCILWHAIEGYHDSYLDFAKELAEDYTIEDIAGGIISWKWIDKDTIFFFEAKDQFQEKGEWAFKVLKAMKDITEREGVKFLQISTRSEKVKRVMARKGFKLKEETQTAKPVYVLVKEV